MNIKQAKIEIKQAIQAYLSKDSFGEYRIPVVKQRPILLIGAPGIGKTAIMEQVARECKIGLVSYTMTHHTRQTAIGLPFIKEKQYGGETYSTTEYTMSEIIAAVYDQMEKTGLKEGILFLDEINCVSETLAPTMLQFLQYKTFGNHQLPAGWIIVTAGNPPEYNKSVREFDLVTLDRVKKIEIEENFTVWKEYAYEQRIHGAILAYLEIKKEHFYDIQTTVDGKIFVTARGWEDLSRMMETYEQLNIPVTEQLIIQYLQHPAIAKDFANYLDLYKKYQDIYHVDEVLKGNWDAAIKQRFEQAAFDEKLSVIGLILDQLNANMMEADRIDQVTTEVFDYLKQWKMNLHRPSYESYSGVDMIGMIIKQQTEKAQSQKKAGLLDRRGWQIQIQITKQLEQYEKQVNLLNETTAQAAFDSVKTKFQDLVAERKEIISSVKQQLDMAFLFMEEVFGDSQEMVIFLTELSANPFATRFISQNGCEAYYRHNRELLFYEKQKSILEDIEALKKEEQLELL